MTRTRPSLERRGLVDRRWFLASLLTAAAGCGGEPEPLRGNDPARAREAALKKRENPNLPPGVTKKSRAR